MGLCQIDSTKNVHLSPGHIFEWDTVFSGDCFVPSVVRLCATWSGAV